MDRVIVYFRCHLCAPSVEWQNDYGAAVTHLHEAHGMLDPDIRAYLQAFRVSTADPGVNTFGQAEGDAEIPLTRGW